jgi:hypothetical protein
MEDFRKRYFQSSPRNLQEKSRISLLKEPSADTTEELASDE